MTDEGRSDRPHQNEEAGDEVEAHKAGIPRTGENIEAADEADSADEVEAHGHFRKAGPHRGA
jgi:hypothetical protein